MLRPPECEEKGEITVIDQFSHFEVHLETHKKYETTLWCVVRRAIFAGLDRASATIGYINNKVEPAILCPAYTREDSSCQQEDHLATVDEKKMIWTCTKQPKQSGVS